MKIKTLILTALVLTGIAASAFSQEVKSFRLDYVLKELEDGKVINSRAYSTLISTDAARDGVIRAGNKVPIPTGGQHGIMYQDVGVNIDSKAAKEVQGQLSLNITAEVSSVVSDTSPSRAPSSAAEVIPPIIRQARWSANVLLPLKKPTLIFSSDDPTLKRQTQLEVTATPIP